MAPGRLLVGGLVTTSREAVMLNGFVVADDSVPAFAWSVYPEPIRFSFRLLNVARPVVATNGWVVVPPSAAPDAFGTSVSVALVGNPTVVLLPNWSWAWAVTVK